MSKQNTRSSGSLLRSFASVLIVGGCMSLFAESSVAQDKGFSIFESAKTASDAAPVVAPKAAFTNPLATLPKTQFGTFESGSTKTVAGKPQLNGAKPGGTYAQDGRSMFRQPPPAPSVDSGKLQPFQPNSLRTDNRPQPDIESKPAPPVVAGDFQRTARPLAPTSTNPAQTQLPPPKIAQVAFQDGGFAPGKLAQGGQSGSAATRFSQSTGNRFNQTPPPSTANRFGGGAAASKSAAGAASPPAAQQPPARTQLNSSRTPFGGATGTQPVQRRQPNPLFQQQTTQQRTAQPPATRQPRRPVQNGLSGFGRQQNARTQQPRTAALPQVGQPNNRRRANPGTTNPGIANPGAAKANKTGSKAAKELLAKWAQVDSELKLPGKEMKLHEFLSQPINGSRKDAINQYWTTFADMASHKLAIEQSQWLASIANPRQQVDQAVLKAAQQDAQNRVLHTEIQLAKSQSLLSDFLPNLQYENGKRIPVLPADTPWVGKLNTMYKEYQARGIVPARFNAIDDILPKARQLIANRADAVNASSQAAQQARNALQSGQSPVANVLEAVRMKAKNQQDFLSNVTGYNRAITDYVLSVRQDINQPKRLASVLIGRKSVQSSVAKKETPEEDLDSTLNESNPTLRQVSTGRRAQQNRSQGLAGESAYQNQNGGSGLQTSSNSLKPIKADQPAVPRKLRFAHGPTKESAAAANFDPAKIKEELPMQQAKASGISPGYNGSVAGNGGNRAGRTAQNQGARRSFNPPGQRGQGGQARPPQQQQRRSLTPPATTGGLGTQQPVTPPARRTGPTFPPAPTGGAAEQVPKIPATSNSNPFKPGAGSSATTSATGGINRSFGGGGFPGGPPKSGSTASRFGGGAGSSGFGGTQQR